MAFRTIWKIWAITLVTLLQVLPYAEPCMRKSTSRLSFRPQPDKDTTLINFIQGVEQTYRKYTDDLEELVDSYNDFNPYRVNCKHHKPKPGQVCAFDPEIEAGPCTKDRNFGYPEGQPCIALKLSTVKSWVPETFNQTSINTYNNHARKAKAALGEEYHPDYIGVTCQGETAVDEDLLSLGWWPTIRYYPRYGIPVKGYFPYKDQYGYQTPLVFVQFNHIEPSVVVKVICKAWAVNLKEDIASVHLEILMD